MKTIFLILLLIISFAASANDTLTLNNQAIFDGKVIKIQDCEVVFRYAGQRYHIPAQDIFSIQFGDTNDEIYTSYMRLLEDNVESSCLKGQLDADSYHGKAGAHVALGILFGPFAVIGAAVAHPTPDRSTRTLMMSQNKDLFNNPEYLSCYSRKAKGKNVGNSALGWAAWVVFILII